MKYEEIMLTCNALFIKEEELIYVDGTENYEWKIGYAAAGVLAVGAGLKPGKTPDGKIITLFGVPVQIDYLRPECVELWKKVG